MNLALGVINETKESLLVIFIRPRLSIIDNKGNLMILNSVTGIQDCHRYPGDWDRDPSSCIEKN